MKKSLIDTIGIGIWNTCFQEFRRIHVFVEVTHLGAPKGVPMLYRETTRQHGS